MYFISIRKQNILSRFGLLIYLEGAIIKREGTIAYIDDYRPVKEGVPDKLQVKALMDAEAAGFNCLEPMANGAELGLPIIADCDLTGRAVAKFQV